MNVTRAVARLFQRVDAVLERVNRLLSAVYIVVILALISVTTYVYVKYVNPCAWTLSRGGYVVHTLISVYLLLNTLTNYLCVLFTSAGTPQPDLEAPATKVDSETRIRSETWRYCTICRAAKPPRAHHCSFCKRCYLRLCHHCPAVGRCVGRDNYPFFLRFVTTAWIGSLFAAASAAYLSRKVEAGTREKDVLFFVTVGGCAVGVAVGVLACWHLYLVGTGQTTIEWLENMQAKRGGGAGGGFNAGVRTNVREALGRGVNWLPWWLVLVLPMKRVGAQDEIW